MQIAIDFNIGRRQNSLANQIIFEEAKPRLSRQCKVLFTHLNAGMKVSVADGINGLWDTENKEVVYIGDLRARKRDLVAAGFPVQHETMKGGYRRFFINKYL